MIDPKAITTFAQYNEDVILAALLHDVRSGFYIDVGANYPTIDSVTKYFYDRGWRGINVEPVKRLHADLEKERPNDINLQCGLGEKEGQVTFREYPEKVGHSTFEINQKKEHHEKFNDYEVPVTTLKKLLQEYKPKKIHFLKIDVEGYEYEVVAGNDWTKYRPEVICIEANHIAKDWSPILLKNNYKLFIKDGLNEYYVADESWQRTVGFPERAILLDYHALKQHQAQSWAADSKELTRLHTLVADTTHALEREMELRKEAEQLSLVNKSYLGRIRRAAIGLSTDWVRYRKESKK